MMETKWLLAVLLIACASLGAVAITARLPILFLFAGWIAAAVIAGVLVHLVKSLPKLENITALIPIPPAPRQRRERPNPGKPEL